MSRRALSRRRLLTPLIILLAGAVITVWATQRRARQLDETRVVVLDLCRAAARGVDLTHRLPTTNPLINGRLNEAMQVACRGLEADPLALEVITGHGDAPGMPAPPATHTARIRVHGVDVLGLRCAVDGGQVVIIGYWLPEAWE